MKLLYLVSNNLKVYFQDYNNKNKCCFKQNLIKVTYDKEIKTKVLHVWTFLLSIFLNYLKGHFFNVLLHTEPHLSSNDSPSKLSMYLRTWK